MNYKLTIISVLITSLANCQQSVESIKFTVSKEYYDNGKLKSTGYFYMGKNIGNWTYWYENGNKEKEGFYKLNAIVESQSKDKINYDSLITNPIYKNVFVQEVADTIDGSLVYVLSDLWGYAWYRDGELKTESVFDSINMITNYIEYYQNGQKRSSLKYKRGRLSGKCEYWYESGKLMTEGYFINNKLDGEYKIWDEDGNKKGVEYYENGIPSGIWKYYSHEKLIKEEVYKDGKLENTKEYKKTAKELGKELFDLIKSNNIEGLSKLILTKEDIIETINENNLPDSTANTIKSELVANFEENKAKSEGEIKKGFENIRKDILKKKCNESITLKKITPTTTKLQNLPFEVGTIEIEYVCNKEVETIEVEIMSTTKGWKIIEGLRKKNK